MNEATVDQAPTPGFRHLELVDWRQFDSVRIQFHPRLTVLTGANATGKSTLLGILARHFNWSRAFSSAPLSVKSGNEWTTVGRRRARRLIRDSQWTQVGRLAYGSGAETPVNVPTGGELQGRVQYDVYLPHQQTVSGAFLTSHRSVSGNYAAVNSIPTSIGNSEALFEQFTNELRTRWSGGWTGKSPQLALKEALMAAAVFGGQRGNDAVDFNPEAYDIWHGFHEILQVLMPPTLGFRRLRVKVPDVIVETRSGDFILDDASGGLTAIVEVAWQIFLRSRTQKAFTVLLDEPENHLHPSLQREFVPNLLNAFPRVQFVLATHSPFVVTATPESAVYALDYNEEHRVVSRELDYANKAASADQTLRRVLGMDSTMPKWAEGAFDRIVSRYMRGGMTPESLSALRAELRDEGLENEFASAVLDLTERRPDGDV